MGRAPGPLPSRVARFGAFEVHLETGELSRSGRTVRLSEKPFRVLAALLERPGEVVFRQELHRRLWPDNTCVDFDNNLNAAVNRLRDALRDSAEGPRFVETLPRRGYRFLAPVEWGGPNPDPPKESLRGEETAPGSNGEVPGDAASNARRVSWRRAGSAAAVLGAGLIALAVLIPRMSGGRGTSPVPRPVSAQKAAAPSAADGRKWIVVFPLDSVGPPDDSHVAAGITGEITGRLAAAGGLVVISHGSASRYDRSGKTTQQIGEDLGVDYILEGTVRRQTTPGGASRVRVIPELIEASRGVQVWSDRYDLPLEDVFKAQSTIATDVVEQLGLILDVPVNGPVAAVLPANAEAYQSYLEARALLDGGSTGQQADEAFRLLQRAVKLDPEFGAAWARLSTLRSARHHFRVDLSEENLSRARDEADRALRAGPNRGDAQKALGYYYYWGRRDYERALYELRRVGGWRDDPDVLEAIASIERRQGEFETALRNFRRAQRLDPLDPGRFGELVATCLILGRWDEAEEAVRRALAISEDARTYSLAWLVTSSKGDIHGLQPPLERISSEDLPEIAWRRIQIELMAGRASDAMAVVRDADVTLVENQFRYLPREYVEAFIHHLSGRPDRARGGLEAARQHLEAMVRRDPADPRFHAYLGLTCAFLGRREEAVREASLAADLHPYSRDRLEGPYWLTLLAQVHAWVGNHELALDQLEFLLGIEAHWFVSRGNLTLHPIWAPLRGRPRFEALKEKAL